MKTIHIPDKRALCSTPMKHFTDFQGVGSDPMYLRFSSVFSVVDKVIDSNYKGFLAEPVYSELDDEIVWYGAIWKDAPINYKDLDDDELPVYQDIREKTLQHYYDSIEKLKGEEQTILKNALKYVSDDFLFCYDNKVFLTAWGMRPDEDVYNPIGSITYLGAKKSYKLKFDLGECGSYFGKSHVTIRKDDGYVLKEDDMPQIVVKQGCELIGWSPCPVGVKVDDDLVFTANYKFDDVPPTPPTPPDPPKPRVFNCVFDAGEHGELEGLASISKTESEFINKGDIPVIKANKGYKFLGWDVEPENWRVEGDKTFVAQYEKLIPWYKRFWLWLTGLFAGKGYLKWLLWLLLALLLLFIFSLFFKDCSDNGIPYPIVDKPWVDDVPDGVGGIYNPGDPYGFVETPGGYEDILPPNMGVLPPLDTSNIVREPGRQAVVGDLLNILMENEDKSILDLAKEFKTQYPEDRYQIVYYDDMVKRMQVRVPTEERESLKAEIPSKFAPDYDLYVFDESLFIGGHTPNDPEISNAGHGWYLDAIHAKEAWDISQGSERLTIAIVDNGFSINHPEFAGKVVMPYNVWTHDKKVYAQSVDHGTHVAGTALALMDNGKGLCGIAPKCAFMPVQVADRNGIMTTTSVLDGVLYALYQGADVINVSLGLELFPGIPENVQQELQDHYFKEEELLWNEVMKISNKHNATIVIAAGNDNVLAGINPLNRPRNFIVVSAVDKNNSELAKADFSNYGLYSTVSAPGVDIYSTYGKDGYMSLDGTSMAAPIVTGAIALMKSINENLTPEQIICVLQGTGEMVNGKIGNFLQLDKALEKVQSGEFGDCDSRPETPSTGDVQVLLSWNDYNDLDLACIDPNEDCVWYKNKHVRSGGLLEIDMNVEPGDSESPIENIYWPVGQAPAGTYYVMGWMYKQHEANIISSPYKLKVVYGDKTEEFEGTLSMDDGKVRLCSFTLGGVQSGTDGNSNNNNGDYRDDSGPSNQSGGATNDARINELKRQREALQRQLDAIEKEIDKLK